jgi:hypothetical protein
LARRSGGDWHYDEQMHVISKLPLVDPPGAEHHYSFIEVDHGKVAAIANTHLVAEPYGPYELRDGVSIAEVEAIEASTRLPQIEAYIEALDARLDPDVPLILVGDFNSPSHRRHADGAAPGRRRGRPPPGRRVVRGVLHDLALREPAVPAVRVPRWAHRGVVDVRPHLAPGLAELAAGARQVRGPDAAGRPLPGGRGLATVPCRAPASVARR